jgi:hypothetical protein
MTALETMSEVLTLRARIAALEAQLAASEARRLAAKPKPRKAWSRGAKPKRGTAAYLRYLDEVTGLSPERCAFHETWVPGPESRFHSDPALTSIAALKTRERELEAAGKISEGMRRDFGAKGLAA